MLICMVKGVCFGCIEKGVYGNGEVEREVVFGFGEVSWGCVLVGDVLEIGGDCGEVCDVECE